MKDLSYWLRKSPQPVAIMVDDKKIDVPRNRRAWSDLTVSIKAMDPDKLTCLDKDGNVIRAIALDGGDDDPKTAASPEMSDLQLFAKLLAEGYQHGMKANQPIIDSAMAFVERQAERLLKADTEIERLRAHIHKLNIQIAELSNLPVAEGEEGIVGAMLAGVMQGQAAAAGQQQGASQVTALKQGTKK